MPTGSSTVAPSGTTACLRLEARMASSSSSGQRRRSGSQDRRDALLQRLVEHHLAALEAAHDLGGEIVGGGSQPAAGHDQVHALGGEEAQRASMSSGRSPTIADVGGSTPSSRRRSDSHGPLRSETMPGQDLRARDDDAGARAHPVTVPPVVSVPVPDPILAAVRAGAGRELLALLAGDHVGDLAGARGDRERLAVELQRRVAAVAEGDAEALGRERARVRAGLEDLARDHDLALGVLEADVDRRLGLDLQLDLLAADARPPRRHRGRRLLLGCGALLGRALGGRRGRRLGVVVLARRTRPGRRTARAGRR